MTNNKIPRICMVSERFYPHVGGSETQALNLSGKLQDKGIPLFVLTRKTLKEMAPFEEIRGIKVYRVLPTGTGLLSLLMASISFLFFLFKHRKEYDIIHCHGMGWAGPVCAVSGFLFGKKTLVKVATAGDVTGNIVGKRQLSATVNLLRLFLLKRSSSIICISREIYDALMEKGFAEEKLLYMPNGVDTERFHPGSGVRSLLPENRINIVFSGRLVYRKGVDVLLRAFKKLSVEVPRMHLHILGSGRLQAGDQYDDELKGFVKDNGLENHVTFHGDVDNVEGYLREADMFAFPSRHEGLPNALLEAMACGLPVVATSIGGIVDVIRNTENGILVKPDDANGLYEAIKKLAESPDLRRDLGASARKNMEEVYSLDIAAQRYLKLYNDLIMEGN